MTIENAVCNTSECFSIRRLLEYQILTCAVLSILQSYVIKTYNVLATLQATLSFILDVTSIIPARYTCLVSDKVSEGAMFCYLMLQIGCRGQWDSSWFPRPLAKSCPYAPATNAGVLTNKIVYTKGGGHLCRPALFL